MARQSSLQGEEKVLTTEAPIDISNGRIVLVKLISRTAVGAAIGSIFGTGVGLVKWKGFKGSLTEGRSFAKTLAILFGLQSYLSQSMKKLRGKDDAINAGVAGCIAGLAVMGPGSSLLRRCVTFGSFSCIFEGVSKDPYALIRLSRLLKEPQNIPQNILKQISFPVLPPFTLPFPFSKESNQPKQPTKKRKSKKKHNI